MEKHIIQLISAFIGSMGFCFVFNVRGKLVLPAAIGGMLCWGVYLLYESALGGLFVPTLIASAFAALYGEVLARIYKAPAPVFLIPTVIALIPGSTLYYMMSYAVRRDWAMCHEYAAQTGTFALGIAMGISLVWAMLEIFRNFMKMFRKEQA